MRPARSFHSVIAILERQDALYDLRTLRHREPQMPEGMRRKQPAARRAVDETQLDQERLDHFLDRIARFRERSGNRLDPNRPTAEIDRDAGEIAVVERIEPTRVDFEIAQSLVGDASLGGARFTVWLEGSTST